MGERPGPTEEQISGQETVVHSVSADEEEESFQPETAAEKLSKKETILELMALYYNLQHPEKVKETYYQRLLELCDVQTYGQIANGEKYLVQEDKKDQFKRDYLQAYQAKYGEKPPEV